MRPLLALAAAALLVVLALVQLASSTAYGDLATRPSFPAFLHDAAPGLLRPFLGGPRARAAAAIHTGDLATAAQLVATLPDDPETADLRGRIAEARGERDAAIAAYIRAGDVVRAEALIDAIAKADPAAALTAQRALVAALPSDPSATEVVGDAWHHLAQFQALAGYSDPAHRTELWDEAQRSFERALALAPNDETYLLTAAVQALMNGDTTDAARWFARAGEVRPNNPEVYSGMALTEAVRGNCPAARTWLARWTSAHHPGDRSPADDPLFGASLRRCNA
jgi:tetratricopeptide (TPR) repeat protein